MATSNRPSEVQAVVDNFDGWLSIPSISTDDERLEDCILAAKWLQKYLRRKGFTTIKLLDAGDLPAVYAELPAENPNAPTLLYYGHYDVQAAGEIAEWKSSPFAATLRGERIYGRGSADDKGQVLTVIDGLAEAAEGGNLAYNIKVVIEGEEEIGSPNFAKLVETNRDLLKADIAYIADTDMLPGVPQIVASLRGVVVVAVNVRNTPTDLHSGTYGGAVSNPALVLSNVLSGLVGLDGKVMIPKFYDGIRAWSKQTQALVNANKPDEKQIQALTKARKLIVDPASTIQMRSSLLPTLEINAVHSGTPINIGSTVIPASASARISCRLVPDQDPQKVYKLVTNYLTKTLAGFEVNFEFMGSHLPAFFETTSPHFQRAEAVAKTVWGVGPKLDFAGGSIGAAADFKMILGIDTILMGFSYPDANIHGANENFPINEYFKGKDFIKRLVTQ